MSYFSLLSVHRERGANLLGHRSLNCDSISQLIGLEKVGVAEVTSGIARELFPFVTSTSLDLGSK